MRLQFYVKFHTEYGESLWLKGNFPNTADTNDQGLLAMEYFNTDYWQLTFECDGSSIKWEDIRYHYLLQTKDGEWVPESASDRILAPLKKNINSLQLIDVWNHAGDYENAFYTAPFQKVLLPQKAAKAKKKLAAFCTHQLHVKAPLLNKHEVVFLTGNTTELGDWNSEEPLLLQKSGNWWTIDLNLSNADFPIAYKYGVYNTREKKFIQYENGDNRILYQASSADSLTIAHDGFVHLPNDTWKGAGIAIPVFSLRSKNSFGVGEFTDISLLVDWANETGLKMIQILPVNDTTATHSYTDSYPYSAVSAFALHPLYINLATVAGKKYEQKIKALKRKQKLLNELDEVDYVEVMRFKWAMLRELYEDMAAETLKQKDYQAFFSDNQHWLKPYAAFCYLREKHGTSNFSDWKTHEQFDKAEVERLMASRSMARKEILFHCFVQYHLHLQLKEAADYAHKKGVVLKGDIAIGISRHSCDAWVNPQLYNMDEQAGAPPDDFAASGQNWEFPTYNWKRMQEDGFAWWRQRFEQMSYYFDAFRIDHILGFFRIWSIPAHAVQGVMGHFVPCLPVHYVEFAEKGIWFDEPRYCKPFINDVILQTLFGSFQEEVKQTFLQPNDWGGYDLLPEYDTQRKVQAHFGELQSGSNEELIREGLYQLIANVILFKKEGSNGQEFHFRIGMEKTFSFQYLIPHVQDRLRELYLNYFYERQDEFWKKEAMQKLPALKAATNMLICGEDLGMVPHCVPEVMQQLGILSLEIQRMPKLAGKPFFNPEEAPYLSVITPSTHDMSTVRGWWEEDHAKTQQFYNQALGQWGDAPYFCESWINRAIILQHLYSPAMWAIFQWQDIMGMSEKLRRDNPHDERINVPANSKHYWRYRMHISLEELLKETSFNEELKEYVENSGR